MKAVSTIAAAALVAMVAAHPAWEYYPPQSSSTTPAKGEPTTKGPPTTKGGVITTTTTKAVPTTTTKAAPTTTTTKIVTTTMKTSTTTKASTTTTASTTKSTTTTTKSTTTTTKSTTTTTKSTTTTSSTCAAATKNANFDDITTIPGVELNPIPVPYMGLQFQGFQVLEVVVTNAAPGVIPHSGLKYAFSNVLTTTTGGTSEWTTNYAGSSVKSFSLNSFYYGCALNLGQGAAAVPTACNIAITGFAQGTSQTVQVASQAFTYNPSSALAAAQMTQGVFNGNFKNLQYVLVQYTLPGGSAALGTDLALVIDDVRYSTCS